MSRIAHGGDYDPEQWPKDVWDRDYEAFALAGIGTLTVGVFAWAHVRLAEDRYDFSVLDAIVDRAAAEGKRIVLATPNDPTPHRTADVPDVEVAERVTPEGTRVLFLLNHGATTVTVACPAAGVDLLGGGDLAAGDDLVLVPTAVVVLRCQ